MDSKTENHGDYENFGLKDKPDFIYQLWRYTWAVIEFLVPLIFQAAVFLVWLAALALWLIVAIFGGFIVGVLDANSSASFRQRQREKGDYRWATISRSKVDSP